MNDYKKRFKDSVKEHMIKDLKLPKDLILGTSILSVTGSFEAFVENYKGILECGGDKILIQTKDGRITFIGTNLCVDYYTNDEMKITGKINQIIFM